MTGNKHWVTIDFISNGAESCEKIINIKWVAKITEVWKTSKRKIYSMQQIDNIRIGT